MIYLAILFAFFCAFRVLFALIPAFPIRFSGWLLRRLTAGEQADVLLRIAESWPAEAREKLAVHLIDGLPMGRIKSLAASYMRRLNIAKDGTYDGRTKEGNHP